MSYKTSSGRLYGVTACTGVVGSQVLSALRELIPPSQIRCLVRAGTSKSLEHLRDCESVCEVDFTDADSLTEALKGCHVVYLNTPPSLDTKAMRTNMAKACSETKPEHIVLLSEAMPMCFYGIDPYWDDHKAGQDAIEATGIPITVLHPGFFQTDFATHFGNAQTIQADDFFCRVGNAPVAYTSTRDLGKVTATIMIQGLKKHGYRRYQLVSETLNNDDAAELISLALGRTIEFRPITIEEFRRGMEATGVPEPFISAFTKVMEFCERGFFDYGDHGQLEELLGRRPRSLTDTILRCKEAFTA